MVHSHTNKTRFSSSDQKIVEYCGLASAPEHCRTGNVHRGFAESEFLDDGLFWFPNGVPIGESVSIASSRMSQKLDEHPAWFDALRTLAVQISQESKFLMTAKSTTTDQFVCRLAELFQIPLLELEPFPKKYSQSWFNEQVHDAADVPENGPPKFKVFFKPLDSQESKPADWNVDELLIALAKTSVLLSVRNKGRIHKATQHRLTCDSKSATRLLVNRKLTTKSVESELLQLGATAWWLYASDSTGAPGPEKVSACGNQKPNANILTLDEVKTENYLSHWTRRRVGPWPDQTDPEYLDDLIFASSRKSRAEVSALCRILAMGGIFGSSHLTRDPRDVVCFSDVPLDEILDHRVFRPHLSRWDFEPYGIAIDRDLLKQLGAQPVLYGDEPDWERMSISDQPFFQLKSSRSSQIEWTEEREWRLLGNLDLKQVPVDQAMVFVKSESDALIVAALSRWPVVILETGH